MTTEARFLKLTAAVLAAAAVVATSVSHCEGAERPKQSQKRDCFAMPAARLAMTKLAPRTRFEGEVKPEARFGKYEILYKLGKGGMGKVYLAQDMESGKPVVIKVISDSCKDDAVDIEWFKQEAQIHARLKHPSIPEVYETGEIDDTHFISMQYIRGRMLMNLISEGKTVSIKKALEIAEQTARILDYMHEQGIIHLDIKPGNILLDDKGNVYLLDFGIAATLPKDGGFVKRGWILGTPGYLSPDAVRGLLDRRSDVYSLGVVLYWMLAGRRPFEAGDLPLHTLHTRPPLPTEFNPHIPKAVEAIVLKALSKDPNDRYQTAGEFADDIRGYLASDKPSELIVNNEARSALLAPETRFKGCAEDRGCLFCEGKRYQIFVDR